ILLACAVLLLLAAHHLWRDRVIDDPIMVVSGLVELALVVQLVVGLGRAGSIQDGSERATYIAYLFTVLIVLPVTVFIAIKERSRWTMGVVLGGAVVVAILVARILQIWQLNV
ncbi:MAG: hypothetical protein L0H79_16550, partial [Intrasporangium sp.]|uniref:hypothetical protein n=1 Tax=Intrasporangium sp. TaxID=1925024 RepID=UPI00264868D3